MVCGNCGQETKGIRINQKLFCTNCGEKISIVPIPDQDVLPAPAVPVVPKPETSTSAIPKRISKDGQEIVSKGREREIDLLEAEEKIIEVIEKQNKGKKTQIKKKVPRKQKKRSKVRPIIKHNRDRADNHKKKDYLVIPNEPDPIKEPELLSPHDDQIEASKGPNVKIEDTGVKINLSSPDTDVRYPLVDKEKIKDIQEKQQRHNVALFNFFKSGASQANKKITKKKIKNRGWKIFLTIGIPLICIVFFVGLVLYVNLYGNKAVPAVKKAESSVSFNYKKPRYVPARYELTYQTSGDSDSINYDYIYLPSAGTKLNIKISKTEIKVSELYGKIINPLNKEYATEKKDEVELWLVNDTSLYFISDNLLYEIISSDKMPREELIKIVDGLL